MQSETKNCQNCKKDFVIEPDDFSFYEKIKVPPPTFCPECRMARRAAWRNHRSLFKRDCDLCKKSIISMYHSETKFPVYCKSCFYSDKWDPMQYGIDIDWNKTFLEQWFELWNKTPKYALLSWGNSKNSEYSNMVRDAKNCYLSYSIVDCEDIMYSENIDNSKSMVDSYMSIEGCDSCYYTQGRANYGCKYVSQCASCINCYFCYDCTNSQDCFMSSNLRNKRYVFRNAQLTKEEYEKALEKENLKSRKSLDRLYKEWEDMIKNEAIHQWARIVSSKDAKGNFIRSAKNVNFVFNIYNSENISYALRVFNAKDSYDILGLSGGELIYEGVTCSFGSSNTLFSFFCEDTQNVQYSSLCSNASNLFGCSSLRNKSYCILNKQYTKEEYKELISKIIKHMNITPYIDSKRRSYTYGEFFPFEMSPYGYNETLGLDFFPIAKTKALELGYNWFDKPKRDFEATLKVGEIQDSIDEVEENILNEIIACEHFEGNILCNHQCTEAFRITNNEFLFYKKHGIPLPKLCPNCRHFERLSLFMQPINLWKRACMCDKKHAHHRGKCDIEFETAYSPERPEIVYCEKCYQAEVY